MTTDPDPQAPAFTRLPDLASRALAGSVVWANDELFAQRENLIKPGRAVFDTGDFGLAWGGISSLQLGLPAVWTGARSRGHPLSDVVRWMAEQPARIAGLRTKGRLAVGYDADLCVFAPDESSTVDAARLQHRHPVTPYAGRRLDGTVRSTWLRGIPIDPDAEPRGRFLTRGEA